METLDKLKHGAGMLCMRAGVQVLPVCIRTKRNKLKLFGGADIVIGEPISYEAFAAGEPGRAEYERITRLIFDRICELYELPLPVAVKEKKQ
jgi:1-acyl-sn-glycerol-3-phosphate acyltransferase